MATKSWWKRNAKNFIPIYECRVSPRKSAYIGFRVICDIRSVIIGVALGNGTTQYVGGSDDTIPFQCLIKYEDGV